MKRAFITALTVVGVLLLLNCPVQTQSSHWTGTVRNAATCSHTDVQFQVTAALSGDIVQIPNCAATSWTSGITVNKQIWIRAQNYTPTPGGTCTRNVTLVNNSTTPLFSFVLNTTFHSGLSGIRVNAGSTDNNAIELTGTQTTNTKSFLMSDNCLEVKHIEAGSSVDVAVVDTPQSTVAWNMRFFGSGSTPTLGNGPQGGSWVIKGASRAWDTAPTYGMLDTNGNINVYLEDSSCFNVSQFPDLDDGGRAVWRYTDIDGCYGVTHGFSSGQAVGRFMEFYNDTFSVTDTTGAERNIGGRYYWVRAGGLFAHDNVVNDALSAGEWGHPAFIDSICEGCSGYPGQLSGAPRQPGWGHDGTNYVSDPMRIWSNTGAQSTTFDTSTPTQIQLGRDYFVSSDASAAKVGYTPYTYPHPARVAIDGGGGGGGGSSGGPRSKGRSKILGKELPLMLLFGSY